MEGEIPSSTKKMINGWFFMGESSKKMVDFPVPCLMTPEDMSGNTKRFQVD
jgi:hypothetical protein